MQKISRFVIAGLLGIAAISASSASAAIVVSPAQVDVFTGGDYRDTYGACFSIVAQASPRTNLPEVEIGPEFYTVAPIQYDNVCSQDQIDDVGGFSENTSGCDTTPGIVVDDPIPNADFDSAVCVTERGAVTSSPQAFDVRFTRNIGTPSDPEEGPAYAWSYREPNGNGVNETYEIIEYDGSTASAASQYNACLSEPGQDVFRASTFDNELFVFDPLSGIVDIKTGGSGKIAFYFLTAAIACREQLWSLYVNERDAAGNLTGEVLSQDGIIGDFARGKYLVFDLSDIPENGAIIRLEIEDSFGDASCASVPESDPAPNSVISGIFVSGTNACGGSIKLEKFTNGHDGDVAGGEPVGTPPNGPFEPDATPVAQVAVGDNVVWTYRVENTGLTDLVNVVVTDPTAAAQSADIICPITSDNTIPALGVGDTVDCTASLPGGAADLNANVNVPTEPGCGDGRPTYANTGEVIGFTDDGTNTEVRDTDDSHYCNPPVGSVMLEKFTNGHDGDDANGTPTTTPPDGPFAAGAGEVAQVAPGAVVTWTYRVTNTGPTTLVDLIVTDDEAAAQSASIQCPNGTDTIPVLVANGVVDCTATLPGGAADLLVAAVNKVDGCGDGRPTYENLGVVTGFIEGTDPAVPVSDDDPSHYCNPPAPAVKIVKFTNGKDANDPNGANDNQPDFTVGATEVPRVAPGDTVTWTYQVTNIGNTVVGFDDVDVTDNQPGVNLMFDSVQTEAGVFDLFEPGDVWLYTADMPAENLEDPAPGVITQPNTCTADGALLPSTAYTNIGTVMIPGAMDEDPSSYCNPPMPRITLEKFTNGHDGDNVNGTPTATPPDGPFVANADPVAQVEAGGPVVWTYRVTNTGDENLVDITVSDADLPPGASISCPGTGNATIPFLATSDFVDCAATLPGGALDLQFGPSNVVQGCGDARPTYVNTGEVEGFGEFTGELVQDMDDSHYCNPPPPPVCVIGVEKTCAILQPPLLIGTGSCEKPIDELKMEYAAALAGGKQIASIEWYGGDVGSTLLGSLGAVADGQVVTMGGFDGSPNDVQVKVIFTDNSSTTSEFHLSCSDSEMNGPEDCGKVAGDGKSNNVAGGNIWLFRGTNGPNGGIACPLPMDPGFPTETNCEFTPVQTDVASCSDLKDVTELTMIWDGPSGVNFTTELGQTITGVANGDVVKFDTTNGSKDFVVQISGADSGASEFHLSCSDDEMNGPEDCGKLAGNGKGDDSGLINKFLFAGMKGEKGEFGCPGTPSSSDGTDVVYGIRVTNPNTSPLTVDIVDQALGIDETVIIAQNDVYELVTDPTFVIPDASDVFTNTVTVTGQTPTSLACTASDSVTITRNEPVAPAVPVSCSDIKDLTGLSMVWNGPSGVTVTTAAGEVFEDVQNGNRISFLANKGLTGNDFPIQISGAVNGISEFHLSCSDSDMDGSDDCGKAQGNGKSNESGLVNSWLLDGMEGEKGSFSCGLDNTGVVEPQPGGGQGIVFGAATLDLGDDGKVKWNLANYTSNDVFINEVTVTWPSAHSQLKKLKLAGDFGKDLFDSSSPTSLPMQFAFTGNADDRKLKAGDNKNLEIEFTEKVKNRTGGEFTISVKFSNGDEVNYP